MRSNSVLSAIGAYEASRARAERVAERQRLALEVIADAHVSGALYLPPEYEQVVLKALEREKN